MIFTFGCCDASKPEFVHALQYKLQPVRGSLLRSVIDHSRTRNSTATSRAPCGAAHANTHSQ